MRPWLILYVSKHADLLRTEGAGELGGAEPEVGFFEEAEEPVLNIITADGLRVLVRVEPDVPPRTHLPFWDAHELLLFFVIPGFL